MLIATASFSAIDKIQILINVTLRQSKAISLRKQINQVWYNQLTITNRTTNWKFHITSHNILCYAIDYFYKLNSY